MPPESCDDIVVTILTGRRPGLLRRTLESLPNWLWDSARFVVLHNGNDEITRQVLDDFVFDVRVTGDEFLQIGDAVSTLFRHAEPIGSKYTLHLEDDWVCEDDSDGEWLLDARRALDQDLVGLVRLRQEVEPVLKHNMISGEPIFWGTWAAPSQRYKVAKNAHYTLNPTLMRTSDLPWPAFGENDAQRRFLQTGLWSAQLVPGVFHHIGEGKSLRGKKR